MTTTDSHDPGTELFVVVGMRPGVRLQITAHSPVAAATAAELWRHDPHPEPMTVQWSLRDDLRHPGPVLLFTKDSNAVVHATELVAGKPASAHPQTCCGRPLGWEAEAVRVCWQDDGPPCTACLTAIREAARGADRGADRPDRRGLPATWLGVEL